MIRFAAAHILAVCLFCLCEIQTTPTLAEAPSIEQFDRWIFGNSLNYGQPPREALETQVDREILRISQAIPLDDAQISRLKLSGYGDVKRFFDRVENARRRFLAMQPQIRENDMNVAYQLAKPLQRELNDGLIGPKSLLYKSIVSTLDEQQMQVWQQEVERANRVRAERAVLEYIGRMQRQVPMTSAQRTTLAELLLAEVKSIRTNSQYTSQLLSYRLSEVPREKLENLFDPKQMEAIEPLAEQGRELANTLRQRGLIDE